MFVILAQYIFMWNTSKNNRENCQKLWLGERHTNYSRAVCTKKMFRPFEQQGINVQRTVTYFG